MKVHELNVTTLHLTEVQGLDPITVHLYDAAPGSGFITVNCFGQSWTYFWGAMGERGIEEFVAGLEVGYLMSKLSYREKTKREKDYLSRICEAVINAIRARRGPLVPT